MINLKKKLTLIEELPSELEGTLLTLVRVNQELLLIMLVYNSPKAVEFCFIEHFENNFDTISAKSYRS